MMEELQDGKYSKENRRCITGVAASKLIDVYGSLPSSNTKAKVALWLSELTKIEHTSFFDAKTHKGYLSKALENRRRKNPDEKRWTWNKRARVETTASDSPTAAANTASNASDGPATVVEDLNRDTDGCLRNIPDCEFCGGYCYNVFFFLGP